jgi:hypothetical protein
VGWLTRYLDGHACVRVWWWTTRLGRVLVTRVGERVPKRAVFDAYRAYCAQNSFEPTTSSSFGRFVCEVRARTAPASPVSLAFTHQLIN